MLRSGRGGALGLVVPGGVAGEFADEHEDLGAGPGASDAEVVQPAAVAQGEFSGGVDAVGADSGLFVDA
jgi:hypothetical protein